MNTILKTVRQLFFLGLVMAVSSPAWSAEEDLNGWEMVKNEGGIQVSLRKVEGVAIKEFRGVATLNTTVDELVALYLNGEQCVAWVPTCKSPNGVESVSATEFRIHSEMISPWPFQNREFDLHTQMTKDPATGEVVLAFADFKAGGKESGCCIRVASFKGYWKFTPSSDGALVVVTYQNRFNPGGGFPAALVNSAIADMPFDTLTRLKSAVEKKGGQ